MTIATRELRASLAFVELNFNLTKRYWGWEVAWLVYSLAAALAVAFIGVAQDDPLLLQTLIIGAIFWNFLSIVFGFIGAVGGAVGAEAGLSFLGIGRLDSVSWGKMLNAATADGALLSGGYLRLIVPGLLLALLTTALTFVNFGVDALSNPQLRES